TGRFRLGRECGKRGEMQFECPAISTFAFILLVNREPAYGWAWRREEPRVRKPQRPGESAWPTCVPHGFADCSQGDTLARAASACLESGDGDTKSGAAGFMIALDPGLVKCGSNCE